MTRTRLVLLSVLIALLGAFTLPLGPASAAPVDARDVTLMKWHGHERKVTLPVDKQMMPGAPRSFRTFARVQLPEMWVKFLDHEPACRSSPTFLVHALRTDGFALGGVGTYPRKGCNTGGGYEAYWAIRHGEWKEVIGTQEVVDCARLEKFGFPSELGVHGCWDGDKVVPYSHA